MEERGVAAGALLHHDGAGAVGLLEVAHLLLDEVERLLPRDALPCVLAAVLEGAFHGVLQPVFGVHGLHQVEAAHAQGAAAVAVGRVAFHLFELPFLVDVAQDAAAVMASRRGPLGGAVDGVFAVLPMIEVASVDVGVVLVSLHVLLGHRLTLLLLLLDCLAANAPGASPAGAERSR